VCGAVDLGVALRLSHWSFSLSLLEQMDQTHGAAHTAETERERGKGVGLYLAHATRLCVTDKGQESEWGPASTGHLLKGS